MFALKEIKEEVYNSLIYTQEELKIVKMDVYHLANKNIGRIRQKIQKLINYQSAMNEINDLHKIDPSIKESMLQMYVPNFLHLSKYAQK